MEAISELEEDGESKLPRSLVVPYGEVVGISSGGLLCGAFGLSVGVIGILITNKELLVETLGVLGVGGSLGGNGLGSGGIDQSWSHDGERLSSRERGSVFILLLLF